MKKKAFVNISAAILTAIISGVVLYLTFFVGHQLQETGLVGIFFVSMFSHLTVLGRGLVVPAFASIINFYNPVYLGIAAGLGAAIGEVTTYYWGLGIQEAFRENEHNDTVSRWVEKYGWLAILIVAASPLPDTPIALLAGTTRFPFKKFLAIQVMGKTAFYSFGAAVGSAVFQSLSGSAEEWVVSLLLLAASIVLCIVVSWSKTREKAIELLRKVPFLRRNHKS
jgi:membrane protein YqaA with SNARE-associated domain